MSLLLLLGSGSGGAKGISASRNSSGEQANIAHPCGIGVDSQQRILLEISPSVQGVQSIPLSILEGGVGSMQALLLEIAETSAFSGIQKILQSLQSIPITFAPDVQYDVFLDGISIKSKITDLSISYSESSIHNTIDINSCDSELFWDCNPVAMEGTSRIDVHIGTRHIYFLLEKRNGDENSFSIWGRSLSAQEDVPYADEIDYSIESPVSAKTTVEDILTTHSLNWLCDDWILPASFAFEGPPMEGIAQIANAIGAVVRCEDDGTICIRPKYPVRPVDMDGAAATVSYDRRNLTRLDYEHIKGSWYNAIEVTGYTANVNLPDMIIEESSPVIGNDVHLRVYWAGEKPTGTIETYVTDGQITLLGETTAEIEEAERVTFINGVASVSKPITSVTSIEWIGDSGESISYDKYSKDLEIADQAYRIANIKYTTTYSRYRINEHYVEMLLALLVFGGESDVSVEIKTGLGDRIAPKLSKPLLTSQNIAVKAGTAWLDANKYNHKRVIIEAAYNEVVVDGNLVYINDAEIDCLGNFHVESCNLIIKGPKIVNNLAVVQCQI